MVQKVDYIIVGVGLAGIAFMEELFHANKTFVVFEDNSQTSSLIAGGVYNPVILKRFTPAWNGHKQLQFALPKYESLERKLDTNFDDTFLTKKVFTSIKDQNNWFVALDKPNLSNYMQQNIEKEQIHGVLGNYGFGVLKGTGRIRTKKLIDSYRKYLLQLDCLRATSFRYEDLMVEKDSIRYQNLECKKVVFCEGFGLKKNPFFNYLPLTGTKGETITIHAPGLHIDFLLKSSVFVMPLGDHYFKVGATFNWTDKSLDITKEAEIELVEKLDKVISVPYTIVKQAAGIRPTVKDRRPLVGVHPIHTNLAVLNGLGTRGVMIAPTVAHELFHHLEKGRPLDEEININRFV